MLKTLLFLVSINLSAHASANLGKDLRLASDPQTGKYQLGVHFSYEPDMMGNEFNINWGILFGTLFSSQESSLLPAQMKWNVYNLTTNSFLADWGTQPSFNGKNLVLGSVNAQSDLAKYIIGNQANIVLVFADVSGNILYNLNVGQLCKTLPTYFSNMTDPGKTCSTVSTNDIESVQNAFCGDKKEELLDYVKRGLLKCEIAAKKFQSMGCGHLVCQ